VILHVWQILHAHQRAAPIEEILTHGSEVEAALGELLTSTYAINSTQADILLEEQSAKAATKSSTSVQNQKGNGKRTPATENPPVPTKKRATSRTPKTPVKRRAAPVTDYEQEDTLAPLSTSKNDAPRSERFEDSDKFFQLLGRSRSEIFDCQLTPNRI
jgi:hypothetical protein